MDRIKTLIIEDEKLAVDLVKDYLLEHKEIELEGVYSDGFQGLKAINEIKPDLVFLDIQMPKITGFEMIELLDFKPEIIFTTAYDEFALKAFEINAVDYLLKPYTRERFSCAVNRAVEKLKKGKTSSGEIENLINHVDSKKQIIDRVVVKKNGKIIIVPVDSIIYIEAQDDYVMLYTEKERYLKQQTMKYFESHLEDEKYIRIHRSYIVRFNQISEIEPYEKETYVIKLKNGTKLRSSKSGYKKIREVLNI
ncbi:LytR/AlgR family response regulator transcription factor [Bacteroidota bacterium]